MIIALFPTRSLKHEALAKRFEASGMSVFDATTVFNAPNVDARPEQYLGEMAEKLGSKRVVILGCADSGFEASWLLDSVLQGHDTKLAFDSIALLEATMIEAGSRYVFFLKDEDRLNSEVVLKKVARGELAKRLVANQELGELIFIDGGKTTARWGPNLLCEVN